MGVRLDGEYWELGVPIRETVGIFLFADLGDPKTDCVGEDICIARTEEGVRNGGLERILLGVREDRSTGVCIYEDELGTRDIVSISFADPASSPTTGEVRIF